MNTNYGFEYASRESIRRNLDGCFFRTCRDGEWENICFSDLDGVERSIVMANMDKRSLEVLCAHLASRLRAVGDEYDLVCE